MGHHQGTKVSTSLMNAKDGNPWSPRKEDSGTPQSQAGKTTPDLLHGLATSTVSGC